jgi:hypothetical protein
MFLLYSKEVNGVTADWVFFYIDPVNFRELSGSTVPIICNNYKLNSTPISSGACMLFALSPVEMN